MLVYARLMAAQVFTLNTTQKRIEQDLFWYPRMNCQDLVGICFVRGTRGHTITARAEVAGMGGISMGGSPRQRKGELGSLREKT